MDGQKLPTTKKSKALTVINLIVAAVALAAFVIMIIINYDVINIRVNGGGSLGEGLSVLVLVIYGVILLIVIAALALLGTVFFILSRKSTNRTLKISALVTFIYHIAALVLSIITFIVAIYVNNSSVS